MINYKLIYSDFKEDTGVSVVIIQTPNGTFKGKARACPEDKKYLSSYAGCKIAEMRAEIKCLKLQKKILKSQIDVLNQLLCSTSFKSTEHTSILFKMQKVKTEYDNIITQIKELEKSITDAITSRDHIITKLYKRSETNKNK